MSTRTTALGPTEKQYAYARKLREQLGDERADEIAETVFSYEHSPWGTRLRHESVTRASFSRYIDALRAAVGLPASPSARHNYSRRTRSYAGGGYSFKCTHEDYPCCGCGQ